MNPAAACRSPARVQKAAAHEQQGRSSARDVEVSRREFIEARVPRWSRSPSSQRSTRRRRPRLRRFQSIHPYRGPRSGSPSMVSRIAWKWRTAGRSSSCSATAWDSQARRSDATVASAAPARCILTARPCIRAATSRCGRMAAGSIPLRASPPARSPDPLQQAFIDHDAAQCSYCTSGRLMSAKAPLAANPHPTPEQVRAGMSGNLCRCANYNRYVESIMAAAASPARSTAGGDE